MAFWTTDLTTRDGAEGATGLASIACFVLAGLTVLSAFLIFNVLRAGAAMPLVGLGYVGELLIFLVAGFRFRVGKGFVAGIVAALVLVLEIATKVIALTGWVGVMINAVCLVVIINGIRGAAAMRRGFPDYDADAEIFT